MKPTRLCHIDDISDPGSKGFELYINNQELLIFLVKSNNTIYGYQNKCPHTGINLEWQPDSFLNLDRSLILCSVHGALFVIDSGECVHGPCNGQALTPVKIEINEQGDIYLK